MPRRDGTGPFGEGPMTGRGEGYCAVYVAPGYAGRPAFGRAMAGRGAGRGAGGCHGHRNRFYATGVPLSTYSPEPQPTMGSQEETSLLQSEAGRLRSMLDTIERRLEQLKTT